VAGRIERQLAALRDLPEDEGAASAKLVKALDSGSGLVVAAAARIVRTRGYADLYPMLESAYAQVGARGRETDPGCGGRAAIVEALAEGEQRAWPVYLAGAATIQLEPVWGIPPHEDTAGELRARSLLALVHTGYPGALDLAAEALADPLSRVRIAAATAIGDTGAPGASAVLRLKIAIGDEEPEVIGTTVGALLALDAAAGLAAAERLLGSESDALREHVGLALGASRNAGALPLLEQWWSHAVLTPERETALVSVALLRSAESVRFLAGIVGGADRTNGRAALKALAPFSHDRATVEAVSTAARSGAVTAEDLAEQGFSFGAEP
jgi:HEAT repeat protein